MSKRRDRGDGGIDKRRENSWRLRYYIDGKRFTKSFHGLKKDAQKELRRLVASGETGQHVAPDKVTLATWIDRWIAAGAPGRRRTPAGRRTLERYEELLRCHVKPRLGGRPLQRIQSAEIDDLYMKLDKLSPRTAHHVHTVFSACLQAAVRNGLLVTSPIARLVKVPSPGESDHGIALDEDQLRSVVDGFRNSVLFPIVAVAAFTGARRNEILALRWSDLDITNKTLRIERAVEQTDKYGLTLKEPKTERGKRTITIDDYLLALLCTERAKHLRIMAGIGEGASVNLSLVRLPDDALMFPNPPTTGENFSFNKLRNPDTMTKEFVRKARRPGFPRLRFHDLRGTHETLLLEAGVPVHVVAARCGHDPAVLLRTYAKRTKKADKSAAEAISALSKGALGG